MWQARTTSISSSILHFTLTQDQAPLSVEQVVSLWSDNTDFRLFYNQLLVDNPFAAYCWEHPPITQASWQQAYEFVLVRSDAHLAISPEPETFRSYYRQEKEVVVFPNLRGDATLIVPCPLGAKTAYAHLGAFVRSAPASQIDVLWKKVGLTFTAAVAQEKRWLSTAGLGVHWLHLRIDSRPKYYRYRPYT